MKTHYILVLDAVSRDPSMRTFPDEWQTKNEVGQKWIKNSLKGKVSGIDQNEKWKSLWVDEEFCVHIYLKWGVVWLIFNT